MNAQQLRELDPEKLQVTAQLENSQRIPLVKKSIARILTILKAKDMETGDE